MKLHRSEGLHTEKSGKTIMFYFWKWEYAFWSLVLKFYLKQSALSVKKPRVGEMGTKRKKQTSIIMGKGGSAFFPFPLCLPPLREELKRLYNEHLSNLHLRFISHYYFGKFVCSILHTHTHAHTRINT